jgi:hypothetical protein
VASPSPAQSVPRVDVEAAADAIGLGAAATDRLSGLQKGVEGRATRGDLITLSPPNASMGVLPMMAGEIRQDWVAAVIATNNFGPSAASVGDYVRLRDAQGRAFGPMSAAQFPQYDDLLRALQEQRRSIFSDRELVSPATPIQPSKDAFVLVVFDVAPDSQELVLAAR